MELDTNGEGWCIACGASGQAAEPDAEEYECDECGKHAVYGAAQLALLGLIK
jgi:predicted RNA-binding Zn-ribbon protein involved in translation (DUF1610 family)